MHTRSRRSVIFAAGLFLVAAVVVACGPGGVSPDATIGVTPVPASADPTPILSAGPIEPGISGAPPASQTETEWGTIWDGVPAGFPRIPGARSADDATAEAVSDAYAVADGDPAEIASMLQTTMEDASTVRKACRGRSRMGASCSTRSVTPAAGSRPVSCRKAAWCS